MTRIKFKYLFPLMLILVCCFVFVGCDNQTKSNPVDDPYQGHIVYELSLDNQWKYFDVVSTRTSVDTFQTLSGIRQCNYDSVYYEIAGLLDFVIYDNVVLTFEYKILDQYDETIEYIATYQLELAANGCGRLSIPYTDISEEIQDDFPYDSVGFCKRYLKLKSISGKVVFWYDTRKIF